MTTAKTGHDTFAAVCNEAVRAFDAGDWDGAAAAAGRALDIEPGDATMNELLGLAVFRRDRESDLAIEIFRNALDREPDNPSLLNNLAFMHRQRGALEQSRKLFARVTAIRPRWGKAWANRATVEEELGLSEQAAEHYRISLKLKPKAASTRLKLARVLEYQGRYDEALDSYDEAIRFRPDHPKMRYNRGLLLLKLGRYEEGFRDMEWRFGIASFPLPWSASWTTEEWDGKPFGGKSLLIEQEQGFGDAIQMARYFRLIKKMGGRVLVRCRPRLARLFENVEGIDRVLNRNLPLDELDEKVDLRVSMMSIPHLLGSTVSSIPRQIPYIDVERYIVDEWSRRIDRRSFNIGVVWTGRSIQSNNDNRSCPLKWFETLSDIPGTTLYSLQKGPGADELAESPAKTAIVDLTAEIRDFADTAGLIKNLDLVITVDTATAHLAGSIGHRTWVLLWSNHCWRYSIDEPESPWYPGMKLFRQRDPGGWAPVMQDVRDQLEQAVTNKIRGDACCDGADTTMTRV